MDLLVRVEEGIAREKVVWIREQEWDQMELDEEVSLRSVLMENGMDAPERGQEEAFMKREMRVRSRWSEERRRELVPEMEDMIEESLQVDADMAAYGQLVRLRQRVAIKIRNWERDAYEMDIYRFGEYQDQWATELECDRDQLRHEGVEERVFDVSPMGSPTEVAGAPDVLALQDEVAKWDE